MLALHREDVTGESTLPEENGKACSNCDFVLKMKPCIFCEDLRTLK